jgi:hypothetical protein
MSALRTAWQRSLDPAKLLVDLLRTPIPSSSLRWSWDHDRVNCSSTEEISIDYDEAAGRKVTCIERQLRKADSAAEGAFASIANALESQFEISARDAGRGTRDAGRGARDAGRGARDAGRGTRGAGRGARDAETVRLPARALKAFAESRGIDLESAGVARPLKSLLDYAPPG